MKDAKKYYDFLKASGMSTTDALVGLQIKEFGLLFTVCMADCELTHGENAMPLDCLNMLEKHYGKRLNKMKPITIFNKILQMQKQATANPDKEAIKETVEYFLSY